MNNPQVRVIPPVPQWLLVDVYMDIASGGGNSSRKEFNRMIEDCKAQRVAIILTKSISRFGRDTVVVLDAVRELKEVGTRVIFQEENLDTFYPNSDLELTIRSAIAQAENESRSQNIRMGIKARAENGKSKLYLRRCYGYIKDKEGKLIVDTAKAEVVELIF